MLCRTLACWVVLGLCCGAFVGCSPADSKSEKTAAGDHDHGDHDHGDHDHAGHDHGDEGHDAHDHGPPGPHGGHTESFDQPGYAFEWIHEDADQRVRIIVLDEAKKNAVPVAAAEVIIRSDKGKEAQTFSLPAVSPDAEGKASEFALQDGALLVALNLGVDLEIEIDGKKFTKKLEPHDHDH